MFSLICGFILLTSQIWLTLASPARYDQRQTGDVNVQIDLKDVKVIALVKSDLLDDYMNYDYVYDYADFTLKPLTKPTTKSPPTSLNNSSESSTASSSMKPASSPSTMDNKITESAFLTTSDSTTNVDYALETSTKPVDSSIIENTSLSGLKDDDKLENVTGKITSTSQGPLENSVQNKRPAKRCKGLDKTGRCLRRRISFLPLVMKAAPELIRSVRKRIAA